MEVRLFSLIETICWGEKCHLFIDLRRFPHTVLFFSSVPLLGRAGSGAQYLSKLGRGSRICFGVIGSETNLEDTKSFNWSQFCSFLLNRSIQENGELKFESKIEEVSLSSFCSVPVSFAYLINLPFLGEGGFFMAAWCYSVLLQLKRDPLPYGDFLLVSLKTICPIKICFAVCVTLPC